MRASCSFTCKRTSPPCSATTSRSASGFRCRCDPSRRSIMNRTQRFLTLWPLAAVLAVPGAALAQETIKVGVLHSLSGTMAISETTLKDTIMMLVDQQNRKGGLLGRKLEAVVVDPASNWPLFAEKARQLLEKDKVAVVFGCWTSVSRKSVLPVFEKDNGLLFYPVQYEGEDSSKNVIYTGAAPNQQAIPAVDYLMKDVGVKRWVLEGTDYVYPRTTNKILEAYQGQGSQGRGHLDQLHAVRPRRLAGASRRDQEVRLGGQEDRRGLHDQRRRERPVLQGAREPESLRGRHSGRRILGRRGGALRRRHQAARRSSGRLELLREHQHARKQGVHRPVACLHQETKAYHQRSDGSALHRVQSLGEGGRESALD